MAVGHTPKGGDRYNQTSRTVAVLSGDYRRYHDLHFAAEITKNRLPAGTRFPQTLRSTALQSGNPFFYYTHTLRENAIPNINFILPKKPALYIMFFTDKKSTANATSREIQMEFPRVKCYNKGKQKIYK